MCGLFYRMCALGNVFDVTALVRDTEANQHTHTQIRERRSHTHTHTYCKHHADGFRRARAEKWEPPSLRNRRGGFSACVCRSSARRVRLCAFSCVCLCSNYVRHKVQHHYLSSRIYTLTLASPTSPGTRRTWPPAGACARGPGFPGWAADCWPRPVWPDPPRSCSWCCPFCPAARTPSCAARAHWCLIRGRSPNRYRCTCWSLAVSGSARIQRYNCAFECGPGVLMWFMRTNRCAFCSSTACGSETANSLQETSAHTHTYAWHTHTNTLTNAHAWAHTDAGALSGAVVVVPTVYRSTLCRAARPMMSHSAKGVFGLIEMRMLLSDRRLALARMKSTGIIGKNRKVAMGMAHGRTGSQLETYWKRKCAKTNRNARQPRWQPAKRGGICIIDAVGQLIEFVTFWLVLRQ